MTDKLKKPIIPGCDNASRSPFGRFVDEGAQGRREEGGSEEGGDVGQLGLLKTQDRREAKIDSISNVIALTTGAQTADIPTLEKELN
jgi:hypothetical protein